MFGLLALHEFQRRQSSRRCAQFGLMQLFERRSFTLLPRLQFTMNGLVAPELVERNGWSRLRHSCLAWERRYHFCFPHHRAVDVDADLPIDIFPTSTGRIEIRNLEARHLASGRLLNLFRRDAEIRDTSVPDFKAGDISGCAQQRDVPRHESDVIFELTATSALTRRAAGISTGV